MKEERNLGKKENPLLAYYNQPERFAQLLNGCMWGQNLWSM